MPLQILRNELPAATYVPQTGYWCNKVEADAPPEGSVAAFCGDAGFRGVSVPRKARVTVRITVRTTEIATKNRSNLDRKANIKIK